MKKETNKIMTPSDIKPGDRFGHWTVIEFHHTNKHRVKYFLCKCDCGTVRPVRASALIQGTSISCSKTCSMRLNIGEKYGRWEIIAIDKSRNHYYVCRCECGTTKSVNGSTLKNGTSKSCGCLKSEMTK